MDNTVNLIISIILSKELDVRSKCSNLKVQLQNVILGDVAKSWKRFRSLNFVNKNLRKYLESKLLKIGIERICHHVICEKNLIFHHDNALVHLDVYFKTRVLNKIVK